MNNKVIAVVVTYNRLELLKRVIDSLKNQTVELAQIIIVNNGSTDGTHEWLDQQSGLTVIHQDNVGGSGGFYRGIQEASKLDCDWIWCMDDDVFPRQNCLYCLLDFYNKNYCKWKIGILCPHRLMSGKTFVSESKIINVSNPLKNTFDYPLTKEDVESNNYISIEGMAFEGPLIRKEVIDKIGLPNKDLFILYDDTDYSYRAILAGYKVYVLRDALMDKYNFQTKYSYKDEKIKNKWKLSYHIRNSAYFGHRYGKNVFVKYMAAVPFLFHMYCAITYDFFRDHKYKFSDYGLLWRMMIRGINEKLGKL